MSLNELSITPYEKGDLSYCDKLLTVLAGDSGIIELENKYYSVKIQAYVTDVMDRRGDVQIVLSRNRKFLEGEPLTLPEHIPIFVATQESELEEDSLVLQVLADELNGGFASLFRGESTLLLAEEPTRLELIRDELVLRKWSYAVYKNKELTVIPVDSDEIPTAEAEDVPDADPHESVPEKIAQPETKGSGDQEVERFSELMDAIHAIKKSSASLDDQTRRLNAEQGLNKILEMFPDLKDE